jgi:hypothetical protein
MHFKTASGDKVNLTFLPELSLLIMDSYWFRENAYKAFKENVDTSNSYYLNQYESMIRRLNSGKNVKFTLSPDAVLKCIIHALESNSPKNYYRVTFPTKLFALLGNILPSKWMDNILKRS